MPVDTFTRQIGDTRSQETAGRQEAATALPIILIARQWLTPAPGHHNSSGVCLRLKLWWSPCRSIIRDMCNAPGRM